MNEPSPSEATGAALSIIVPETLVDWERYFDLRWRVLREPWQQPRGSERDDRDDESIHIMIRGTNGDALAVGRLHLNSAVEAQVRFMAVDPRWQGRGFGSTVLRDLERRARILGASSIVLNARDNAQRFYQQQGYRIEGRGETLFGAVPHMRMRKAL